MQAILSFFVFENKARDCQANYQQKRESTHQVSRNRAQNLAYAGDGSVHRIAQIRPFTAPAPHGKMFRCSLLSKRQKPASISLIKIHGGDTTGTTVWVKFNFQAQAIHKTTTSRVGNSGGQSLDVLFYLQQNPSYQQKCVENLMDFTKKKKKFSVRCLVSQHATRHTQLYNIN